MGNPWKVFRQGQGKGERAQGDIRAPTPSCLLGNRPPEFKLGPYGLVGWLDVRVRETPSGPKAGLGCS
jgi:hypothetical protein